MTLLFCTTHYKAHFTARLNQNNALINLPFFNTKLFGVWLSQKQPHWPAIKTVLLKSALHQSMSKICSFELTTFPLPLRCCQTTQPSGGMQIVDALPLNFWRNHSALLVVKTAFQIANIFPAPEQFFPSAARIFPSRALGS
jgi:hypothetical protein